MVGQKNSPWSANASRRHAQTTTTSHGEGQHAADCTQCSRLQLCSGQKSLCRSSCWPTDENYHQQEHQLLTSKLWTEAGQTNGSEGVINYIIQDSQKRHSSLPVDIIVTSNSYVGPPFPPGLANNVPTSPVTTYWHSQNRILTRRMLPTILGYALSIHKLQGNTSYRLILNVGEKEFAA